MAGRFVSAVFFPAGGVAWRIRAYLAAVVFSGGVCSNSLLRQRLGEKYSATFAAPEFSSDNAAGVAVLAWKKRCQG